MSAAESVAPRRAHAGSAVAAVFILASIVLSFGHLGSLINLAYLPLAVGVAVWLILSDRQLDLLEFIVWLWLLDPEVRRFADYGSRYHSSSPIIITAGVVSLLAASNLLLRGAPVVRAVRNCLAVTAVVVTYGFVSGVAHGHVGGAVADLVFYGGPLGLGVFVLGLPDGRDVVIDRIAWLATYAAFGLGVYGIVQFLVAPPWDVAWVVNSGITAVGQPAAFKIRVFSTLDTAGPFAQTMVVLLLFAMSRRVPMRIRTAAIGVGVIALGLSLVRAAWIAMFIAVVLLTVTRRLQAGRLLIAAGTVVLLIAAVGGPVRTAITDRFDNSVQAGGSDTSLQARTSFQAQIAPAIFRNVGGQGLGSTGVATHLASNSTDSSIVRSFDSGIFEIMYSMGSGPGAILLFSVIGCVGYVWRRALRQPPVYAFMAAGAISLVTALVFTNTMKGVYGAMFWLVIAMAGRQPIELTRRWSSRPVAAAVTTEALAPTG